MSRNPQKIYRSIGKRPNLKEMIPNKVKTLQGNLKAALESYPRKPKKNN
jgi:hypothetical protein